MTAFRLAALSAAATLSLPAHAHKDLIVSSIEGIHEFGTVNGLSAYAIGTTACNNGTEWLAWFDFGPNANQHPVIATNLYRLKDGRFQQIGMSWLKHGFCAADQPRCGDCIPATSCDWLGVGCSDTYSAILNGNQFGLGPRSLVNPSTGFFPADYPFPQGGSVLAGRLQVKRTDLRPDFNPGALYFGEAQYITPDDASGPFANNNSTFRQVTVGEYKNNTQWDLDFTGPSFVGDPAIQAWQDHTPGVVLVDVDVPNDGRFVVGGLAIDQGDGTWRYEYAVMNVNSDRAASSFEINTRKPDLAFMGFADIHHHSGEPYETADWIVPEAASNYAWLTPASASTDPFANALRWGTLYNFWLVSDNPPTTGSATLGRFKPGTPNSIQIHGLPIPSLGTCPADHNNDGTIDFSDALAFLDDFSDNDPAADLNSDNSLDFFDIQEFLEAFSLGCP